MRLLSRALSAVASPVASQTLRAGIASAVRVPGTARQALSTPTFRTASTVPTTKPESRLTGPCLVATRRHLSSTTSRNYSSSSSSSENDSDSDGAFVTAMDEDDFSSPASNARDSLPTSGCNLKHQLLSWQEQRHRLRHGSAQHIVSMQPVPSTFSAIIAEEDASLCRLDHRLLEQTHAIGSLHAAVHMSSTLKKRRRKMKKHKHRKWLRKMKSVWASLKK